MTEHASPGPGPAPERAATGSLLLTDAQLAQLAGRGVSHVSGFIAAGEAAVIEDRIWAWLHERDGVDRDRRSTWPAEVKKLQPLRKAGVLDPFDNDRFAAVGAQLLGAGCHDFGLRPQALMSFPCADEWVVPHKVWHFDLPARGPTDHMGAIRLLGFVSRVEQRGGGTLVVVGSHELVRRMVEASPESDAGSSADVRRALIDRSPWFRALAAPGGDRVRQFMTDGDEVDGVHVRVEELTGDAGDAFLMHPWTLHNIGQNTADRPRMMVSHSLYAHDSTFF